MGRENTKSLKKGVEKPRSKHKIPVCIFLPPPSLWARVAINVYGCNAIPRGWEGISLKFLIAMDRSQTRFEARTREK